MKTIKDRFECILLEQAVPSQYRAELCETEVGRKALKSIEILVKGYNDMVAVGNAAIEMNNQNVQSTIERSRGIFGWLLK